jgi:photosystem II stability/assembly factor-like uncharacterized protein
VSKGLTKHYLTVFVSTALLFSVLPSIPSAAVVAKKGASCTKINQRQKVGKTELICVRSGKKLIWQVYVAPQKSDNSEPLKPISTPSPNPSPSASAKVPVIGWICDGVKDIGVAKDSSGVEVVCNKGGDGVFAWRPKAELSNNQSPSRSSPSPSLSQSLLPPAPTPTPTPSTKITLDTYQEIPASAIVQGGKVGAPCEIEGTRSYPGSLWEILVCAPKPNTRELVWHNNYAAFMYAGLDTGGILPSEPCLKDGETRGVPQGTLLCTTSLIRNRLEWVYQSTLNYTYDWPYQDQIMESCGPRLGIGSGEYYRIYGQSLLVDPENPLKIWAVVEKLGVYLSKDGGKTWSQVTIPNYSSGMRTLDGKVCWQMTSIFKGTGTDSNVYLGQYGGPGAMISNKWITNFAIGNGLYATNDEGKTWNITVPKSVNMFWVSQAFDPSNREIMYWGHGTESGTFRRSDGTIGLKANELPWLKVGFIEKSTDGGKTWNQLPTGLDWPMVRVVKIHVSKRDSNEITAFLFQKNNAETTSYSDAEKAPVFIRSRDGGKTWSTSSSQIPTSYGTTGKMNIAISPDEKTWIVCTSKERIDKDSCFVSKDYGETFTRVAQRLTTVTMNPSNSNEVIGFGTPSSYDGMNKIDGIYRSSDGGSSWSKVAAAPSTLTMDAANPPTSFEPEGLFWATDGSIYLTGGGGLIYRSTDKGVSWNKLTTWEDFARVRVQ